MFRVKNIFVFKIILYIFSIMIILRSNFRKVVGLYYSSFNLISVIWTRVSYCHRLGADSRVTPGRPLTKYPPILRADSRWRFRIHIGRWSRQLSLKTGTDESQVDDEDNAKGIKDPTGCTKKTRHLWNVNFNRKNYRKESKGCILIGSPDRNDS